MGYLTKSRNFLLVVRAVRSRTPSYPVRIPPPSVSMAAPVRSKEGNKNIYDNIDRYDNIGNDKIKVRSVC